MSTQPKPKQPTYPPGSFRLANGVMTNVAHPDPATISIGAIVTGLAKICRYGGQLPGDTVLSVAEHSVLVARRLPPALQKSGLLHDASEALGLCDMPSDVKALFASYRECEARVMDAVADAFGMPRGFHEHHQVKDADRRMLGAEQVALRGRTETEWPDRFENVRFECWNPADARLQFLTAWEILEGGGAL